MMPGKRKPTKYYRQYDAKITFWIERGLSLGEVGKKVGVSSFYVARRGHAIGLSDLIRRNGAVARNKCVKRGPGGRQSSRGRQVLAAIDANSTPDRSVSLLARSMRARRVDLSEVAVAALHERGLTLDELEAGTGLPPVELVRVVREAARCA